jgi:hypothetical protein
MGFKDGIGLQSKAIKKILDSNIEAWLKTLPDSVAVPARGDAIVTGGCIASMLLGEEIKDIDLYFRTYETAVLVAKHYVGEWKGRTSRQPEVEELLDVRGVKRVRVVVKSEGVVEAETEGPEEAGDVDETIDGLFEDKASKKAKHGSFEPVFMSSNAITLAGKTCPLQIVLRFWGEPDTIHGTYDFVHCTNYWEAATDKLELRPEAMRSLLSRTLIYRGSLYPLCSIIRIRKFVARGWRISAGQILKMALQVSKLDLTKFKVLEDQLTGVDAAYFGMVLDACNSKDPESIDSTYLAEVIEKVFGD